MLAPLQKRIYITAEALRIDGWDVERLYASPKARAAVQHQFEGAFRYAQRAWDVLVRKSSQFRSAKPPGRTMAHVMTRALHRPSRKGASSARVLPKRALAGPVCRYATRRLQTVHAKKQSSLDQTSRAHASL